MRLGYASRWPGRAVVIHVRSDDLRLAWSCFPVPFARPFRDLERRYATPCNNFASCAAIELFRITQQLRIKVSIPHTIRVVRKSPHSPSDSAGPGVPHPGMTNPHRHRGWRSKDPRDQPTADEPTGGGAGQFESTRQRRADETCSPSTRACPRESQRDSGGHAECARRRAGPSI